MSGEISDGISDYLAELKNCPVFGVEETGKLRYSTIRQVLSDGISDYLAELKNCLVFGVEETGKLRYSTIRQVLEPATSLIRAK